MLPTKSRSLATLPPRWRFGGLVRNWLPECAEGSSVHPDVFQPRIPQMMTAEVFTLDTPERQEAASLTLGEAISYEIGWYDLSGVPPPRGLWETENTSPSDPLPHPVVNELALRLAAVLQPPLAYLFAPSGVLDWPAPLLPYQQEGISALLQRSELLLADDMGLGKTVQAIAALRLLYFQRKIESALVVCPASLLAQWKRELARWGPELKVITLHGRSGARGSLWRVPAHVRLISYETLRADVMDVQDSPALRQKWGVMVLDEASRIKNHDSAVSLACKRVPRLRRWALTGTPLENSLDDLLSLYEFLQGDPDTRRNTTVGVPSPREAVTQLKTLQLRRKKEEVLKDLPPKQVNELILNLPPGQRAAYDRAEREGLVQLREAAGAITITHVLELIGRLKQICNYDPASGESTKLTDIAARLLTLYEEGHRALVFSQFTDDTFGIGRAARWLKEFHPLLYTGSMTQVQRAAVIDRFLSDTRHRALLLSLRAGGMGLNLQAASYVFHLDRWWNPAIEEQADSRAHRMGQVYPVTVFRYVCADTVEERIQQKLREKRQLFAELVDDVSLDLSTALNEQELFGLFGLTAPRPPRSSSPPGVPNE